jgi:uncharacterized DUF497 family protein
MELESDPRKAVINQRKHGVTFEEAKSCLFDPSALAMEDRLSGGEGRWLLVGRSERFRMLTVVYTLREERIRLISARKSTKREIENYAKGI